MKCKEDEEEFKILRHYRGKSYLYIDYKKNELKIWKITIRDEQLKNSKSVHLDTDHSRVVYPKNDDENDENDLKLFDTI